MTLKTRIERFRKLAEDLKLKLVASVLGEDALTPEEVTRVKKLPGELKELGLTDIAYQLGKLRSLVKIESYRGTTFSKVKNAQQADTHTPLEQKAIEYARTKSAEHIKGLADDIINGVFADLQASMDSALTEASIKEVVRDETTLALMENKSAEALADGLSTRLKVQHSDRWSKIAATELHNAKVQGEVQAIINKVGIYAVSDGANSRVSVIPAQTCCEDCSRLYTEADGTPKIFLLADLIAAGSNADAGVSHKRQGKIHPNWKTTLPPVHPRCCCSVHYVPNGAEWRAGKLIITDMAKYEEGLYKAYDVSNEMTNPASLPKVKAPENVAGPGAPKGGGGGKGKGGGPGIEYEYKPASEGKPDGPGWEMTEQGGSYRRPAGMSNAGSAADLTEEDKQLIVQSRIKTSTAWNKTPRDHSVVLDKLKNGKINTIKSLNDLNEDGESTHANEVYKVSQEGGGNAVLKPPAASQPKNALPRSGMGYMTPQTEPQREKSAYFLAAALGCGEHVPPTETRTHEGQIVSMQQWKEDSISPAEYVKQNNLKSERGMFAAMLDSIPEQHREHIENKLKEIATIHMVMNNMDAHVNNLAFNKDLSDVHAIDHGCGFGNGLHGSRNGILNSLSNLRRPFKIPEKLKTKLDTMSLGDYKRSLGSSGITSWEIGQTFLRSRYISHLQDTEGYIDHHKFMPTLSNADNSLEIPAHAKRSSDKHAYTIYEKRKEKGQLPNQLFESWAKGYMLEAAADPTHKDHWTAKELDATGVFMGPKSSVDARKYRMAGKHKEYEKSIVPGNPPAKLYNGADLYAGDAAKEKAAVQATVGKVKKKPRPAPATP